MSPVNPQRLLSVAGGQVRRCGGHWHTVQLKRQDELTRRDSVSAQGHPNNGSQLVAHASPFQRKDDHSILSLAFAATVVCHCMFPGASAPPRFRGTM